MFPISKETLSFREISDFWSREVSPPASRNELLNLLISAWWRGEIVGDALPRLQFLRRLFISMSKFKEPCIVFISGDEVGPAQVHEFPDGCVEVDIRPRACVSSNTDDWDEATCDPAFRSFEEIEWDKRCPELFLTFRLFNLSRAEFMNWVVDRGFYSKPTFWGGDVAGTPPPPVPATPFDKPGSATSPLKHASVDMINKAIGHVYDSASKSGQKAPNVKEIIEPVQEILKRQGSEASGLQIQELAGQDQYKERRRKPGATVASETRRQKK
jgi:hypothetical protein